MRASDPPVVVEQTLEASPDQVWRAITDPQEMTKWFFDNIPDFRPEIGFETRFNIHHEGRDFMHCWKVTEAVAPERLVYDWSYEGYEGDSYVTFELKPTGEGTHLKLTATIRQDFPDDIPEFRRESCVGGWRFFLQERLKAYLNQLK